MHTSFIRCDRMTRRFTGESRRVAMHAVGALLLLISLSAHAGVLDRVQNFDIPSESLQRALLDFGHQSELQVILRATPLRRTRTRALAGRYTVKQALTMLLNRFGLTYVLARHVLSVVPANAATRVIPVNSATPMRAHPPLTLDVRNTSTKMAQSTRKAQRPNRVPPSLRQVVVTGTHISGIEPQTEPIITITRRQIRESGYQSVQQLMDGLPENFADIGSNFGGNAQAGVDAGNLGYGAAVDLLGLGYDSSLVLVDGHRLAPSGINGAFTDISVIPLSAIKRVDVVTDGASAIYGADAIGGVVNYILRNHQRGAESSVEYGQVTTGGMKEYRATQSQGLNWKSGHALLSYEYHDATPLNVRDRPFSAAAAPGYLTPGMTLNSVYLNGTESVRSGWRLNAQALYAHRRISQLSASGTRPFFAFADTSQYSYGIGSRLRLPAAWSLRTRLSYGRNDTHLKTVDGTLSGENQLITASAVVSGGILKIPSGEIRSAVGIQGRYESLTNGFTGLYVLGRLAKSRIVDSAFFETAIPLMGRRDGGLMHQKLTLDLAGRLDHYSDFGSSANPRIGLAWEPFTGVKLRGTASSSFKAPNFYQLFGAQNAFLVNSPEPQIPLGETVPLLYITGSNPSLTAEKAKEWTVGLDISPESLPGFSGQITYYDVSFTQRIVDLNIPLFAALDQGNEYASYIFRNPNQGQLQSWLAPQYNFENLTTLPGFGPARGLPNAVAIADDRFHNVGQTRSNGVLSTISYVGQWRTINYDVNLNSAYIIRFRNKDTSTAPSYSVLSTLNHPVNFRARASMGVRRMNWGLTAFVNYINHYRDVTTGSPVPIASWTTLDMTGSYRLPRRALHWARIRLYLTCRNCLNRSPPAVRPISAYLGYDATNANPLGRFVQASIDVNW